MKAGAGSRKFKGFMQSSYLKTETYLLLKANIVRAVLCLCTDESTAVFVTYQFFRLKNKSVH